MNEINLIEKIYYQYEQNYKGLMRQFNHQSTLQTFDLLNEKLKENGEIHLTVLDNTAVHMREYLINNIYNHIKRKQNGGTLQTIQSENGFSMLDFNHYIGIKNQKTKLYDCNFILNLTQKYRKKEIVINNFDQLCTDLEQYSYFNWVHKKNEKYFCWLSQQQEEAKINVSDNFKNIFDSNIIKKSKNFYYENNQQTDIYDIIKDENSIEIKSNTFEFYPIESMSLKSILEKERYSPEDMISLQDHINIIFHDMTVLKSCFQIEKKKLNYPNCIFCYENNNIKILEKIDKSKFLLKEKTYIQNFFKQKIFEYEKDEILGDVYLNGKIFLEKNLKNFSLFQSKYEELLIMSGLVENKGKKINRKI